VQELFFLVESLIAGTLSLQVMRILAVFPHSNGITQWMVNTLLCFSIPVSAVVSLGMICCMLSLHQIKK